jgi:hypothetical protein
MIEIRDGDYIGWRSDWRSAMKCCDNERLVCAGHVGKGDASADSMRYEMGTRPTQRFRLDEREVVFGEPLEPGDDAHSNGREKVAERR